MNEKPLSTGNAFDWRAKKPDVKVFVKEANSRKSTPPADSVWRKTVPKKGKK